MFYEHILNCLSRKFYTLNDHHSQVFEFIFHELWQAGKCLLDTCTSPNKSVSNCKNKCFNFKRDFLRFRITFLILKMTRSLTPTSNRSRTYLKHFRNNIFIIPPPHERCEHLSQFRGGSFCQNCITSELYSSKEVKKEVGQLQLYFTGFLLGG